MLALNDVTITLKSGEVLGLVGANGAGKSTLVNILSGFSFPNHGNVELDGTNVTTWTAVRRSRNGIARTFQHGHVFKGLTVRENIEVAALSASGGSKQAANITSELLGIFELKEFAGATADVLSHGQERMVGLARAMATEPQFILMDEPAAGLNDFEVRVLAPVITSLARDRNIGVMIIDHNLDLIRMSTDRVHLLDQGTTMLTGTPADVLQSEIFVDCYLGGK